MVISVAGTLNSHVARLLAGCMSRDKQQPWRERIPCTTLSTRHGNPEQKGPLQFIQFHLLQYTWKPKDSNLTISF